MCWGRNMALRGFGVRFLLAVPFFGHSHVSHLRYFEACLSFMEGYLRPLYSDAFVQLLAVVRL